MKNLDGIILDVDGTLWDSTGIVAKAWTQAVRECGIADAEILPKTLKGLFGRTMDKIAEALLPGTDGEFRQKVMERCCVYEQAALHADPCKICYPKVVETIRELAKTVPVYIVSNCQAGYIELFLEKTGTADVVSDIECFGNNGKNKDENIRLLMERNGLKEVIYVGDTQGDCEASAKAGVPFVFAAYGFGCADSYVRKIESFDKLLELVHERKER